MIIRPIKPSDLEKVEQLIKSAILAVDPKDQRQAVTDFRLTVDPYRPRNTAHERDYFVAEDGEIRGVLGLKDNELKTFFVDPKYQGQGVGKALIKYVGALMVERGYSLGKVFSSLNAKGFYQQQGYVIIREDITKIGQEDLIRFYMEKELI